MESEILKLYKSGMSVRQISRKLMIAMHKIYYVLNKHNIKIKRKNDISTDLRNNILKDIKTMSIAKVSQKYNIEKTYLHKYINSICLTATGKKIILNMNKMGKSAHKIAQHLSILTSTVKDVLEQKPKSKKGIHLLDQVGITKEEIEEIRNKMIRDNF